MPPKIKVTKEDIISTAVDIVRNEGAEMINARNIAALLNCSTQPVFSNFVNMDELRLAIVQRADEICNEYIKQEIKAGKYPEYKASGMAYIRFAKEEKQLFRLLYMRDRSRESIPDEMVMTESMEGIVHSNTGLSGAQAKLFHLEMWAYVHGIAAMCATGFVDIDWGLIDRMLTDAYMGMRRQYGLE